MSVLIAESKIRSSTLRPLMFLGSYLQGNALRKLCQLVLVPVLLLNAFAAMAQGSLTPPGAPAATMKTLGQIEPRTPISSLPFKITNSGSFYLTGNLTGMTSSNGITISANHVALDLNGFSLIGGSNSGDGITSSLAVTNVVIRNGTIRNWGMAGIDLAYEGGYGARCEQLQVLNNDSWGIALDQGSFVKDCVCNDNGNANISVNFDSLVVHCTANGSFNGIGILGATCSVIDCVANSNFASGIYVLDSSRVENCVIAYNSEDGIVAGSRCLILGNSCTHNNPNSDSTQAAIRAISGQSRIDGNHVEHGTGKGIYILTGFTNCVVIRNSTMGTTNIAFSFPAGNDVGPIGKATTATSPWANLVH
jgi:hypothetical protein